MQVNTVETQLGSSPGGFAQYLPPAIFVLFFLFSYWMYGYRPIASFPRSSVDDGLYLRHANAFVNWVWGNNPLWLGDYDCFLFAKSPLYGVFLGIFNLLCVPVRVGEFALLAGLPFFFAAACRPLIAIRGWRFLIIAALLIWLPVLPNDTHLQRMALQCILTSYLIVACIGLVLRWGATFSEQCRWGVFLGLLFSFNYLNREESAYAGILILFSFVLLCVLSKVGGCFIWRRSATVGATIALCALPLILIVCYLNYRSYGVFLTTIRRSTSFTAAYQRLTSLEPEFHKRYIPISRQTRFRAYDLSPTFAKLKPIMEGHSTYWVAGVEEHSLLNGYTAADGEFFVSNFEFALEYAASVSGATNAVETERFFAQIEEELSNAVRAGKIKAGVHGPAILAAPVSGDGIRIIKAWWESLRSLFVLKLAGIGGWAEKSAGDEPELQKISLFVHSSIMPEPLDGNHYTSRVRVIGIINQILRVIYSGTIPVMLAISIASFLRNRAAFFRGAAAASVPLLGLFLFCLTMAVIDTLGFPFLGSMAYNVMGYAPMSVLSAFTFVITLAIFQKAQSAAKVS